MKRLPTPVFFFFSWPLGMWDLGSLTRDGAHTLYIGRLKS